MNMNLYLIIVSILVSASLSLGGEEIRTWTSKSGKELKASYSYYKEGTVYLVDETGKKKMIKLSSLSDADAEHVRKVAADSIAAEKAKEDAGKKAEADKKKREDEFKAIKSLFGSDLVTSSGSSVSVDKLKGKTIALYFSASWCPPCRAFTPKLVKMYDELKAQGKPFEVVLIPSDQTTAAMQAYMTKYKMKWPAVNVNSAAHRRIAKKYSVRGIPALIVIKPDGSTVSKNARGEVSSKGSAAFAGWRK